jgi:hypothetical protein
VTELHLVSRWSERVIWWFASSAWSWSLAKSDFFMVFPTLTCNSNLLAVRVITRLLGGIPHTDLQQSGNW